MLVASTLAWLPMCADAADRSSLRHKLTIDDVLDTVALERVTPSPDGDWLAAVVQRPARSGEVFGRNSYEVDPSRDDVWLISRRTGAKRNLTEGAGSAAGFWCATWSPDGRWLAMLSTRPEGKEPRGGDNVRLYIWSRDDDSIRRLSPLPVMTQGRYGSGLYPLDLRGGADGSSLAHPCLADNENAPFVWLDDNKLLALTLPEGETSALLDQYERPSGETARTHAAILEAQSPTATAVGSGAERMARDERRMHANVTIFDPRSASVNTIADVPIYPFGGTLTLSIAPDRRRIAIMATLRTIAQSRSERIPYNVDDWHVEKRLGFVNLAATTPIRWATLPTQAKFPVELLDWAPDGRRVAFRARGQAGQRETSLFVALADELSIERVGSPLMAGSAAIGQIGHEPAALWVNDRQLIVSGRSKSEARDDWWLVQANSVPLNLTSGMDTPPQSFRRDAAGRLVAIAGTGLVALDPARRQLTAIVASPLPSGASIAWPSDPARRTSELLISDNRDGAAVLHRIELATGRHLSEIRLPPSVLHNYDHGSLLWSEQTSMGLFLRESRFEGRSQRDLLSLDTHLASVAWGRTFVFEYADADGHPLKAAVILPPDHRDGQRYPVLTWVYGGYMVQGADDYWLNRYLPGAYNLQLYAAHGYAILIPSMPIKHDREPREPYPDLPGGVLPAIDRLVALGVADPSRVGVMGQSFGGYSVYGLVTQTDRFRAAIALAGVTDLTQSYAQFDPTARGFPGIEHEKSINWSIYENAYGFRVPPYENQSLYSRNSPITFVSRVKTPLLLMHGELDGRNQLSQADAFFFELYRQGATARLLRYWGENHSLARSPANVRDVVREAYAWLDKYLAPTIQQPDTNSARGQRHSPAGSRDGDNVRSSGRAPR